MFDIIIPITVPVPAPIPVMPSVGLSARAILSNIPVTQLPSYSQQAKKLNGDLDNTTPRINSKMNEDPEIAGNEGKENRDDGI